MILNKCQKGGYDKSPKGIKYRWLIMLLGNNILESIFFKTIQMNAK